MNCQRKFKSPVVHINKFMLKIYLTVVWFLFLTFSNKFKLPWQDYVPSKYCDVTYIKYLMLNCELVMQNCGC